MTLLPKAFYEQGDVVDLAQQFLGKWLITNFDGQLTGGMIIETEAYKGPEDKASHAYNNRRTKRTEVMFASGGVAYVYLCYGMHNLFNIVTNKQGTPHAILVRALKPGLGIEIMQQRRKTDRNLTNGPGTVCQALGITCAHNGHPLNEAPLWIEDRGVKGKIESSARIGVGYAQEHAALPWRFLLKMNP